MTMIDEHLNICVTAEMRISIDTAADKRNLNRSEFIRWAMGRTLSGDEPYVYTPPTLPNWQVEAWTSLLRGLFGVEYMVLTTEIKMLLIEAVAKLSERDRQVLVWRFGLDGPRYMLAEVGDMQGVQRETVRQIEAKALRRLRFMLAQSGIWKLLEPQLDKEKT